MRSTRLTFIGLQVGVLSLGLAACLGDGGTTPGTTGGAGGGTSLGGSGGTGVKGGSGGTGGGMVGTGGTGGGMVGTGGTGGGTGGSPTGGSSGSGGSGATAAGTAGSPGGSPGTAGSGAGTGGTGAAGMSAMGGMTGMTGGRGGAGMAGSGEGAGMSGSSGAAGASAGTGSTGECTKGSTAGKDVAVIGESFIAASHQITQEIEAQAKAAGSLPQSDKYVDNSVSGTTLANNQIPSQYDKAVQSSGTIKYVLMDGGGNDCLINNNGAAALTAATTLFQNMATHMTEKIVYFFYPDPIGSNFASLKSCLDTLRPQMKALCDGLTSPKCYWLDLRPVWNGHNEYTSDGIHPTTEGAKATGDAVWKVMVDNCVAQ